jgi:hypothetical protein
MLIMAKESKIWFPKRLYNSQGDPKEQKKSVKMSDQIKSHRNVQTSKTQNKKRKIIESKSHVCNREKNLRRRRRRRRRRRKKKKKES